MMLITQPNLFSLYEVVTQEDKDNDENYTPEKYVKPFRDLVGGFHLDAFSCARANAIIQAKTYWTKADDAFSKDLTGGAQGFKELKFDKTLPKYDKLL